MLEITFLFCNGTFLKLKVICNTVFKFKARSHGAIYLHTILWNCSHSAMGVDAICYVYI